MQIASALADAVAEMLTHSVRHQELRIFRPAVEFLGQPDFFFAQRFAVSGIGVLLVRRSVADVAVDDDQRRPVCGLVERFKRPRQHFEIIGVGHASDVPSVAHKTRRHIFAERPVRRTIERDVIVVVDPAEIGEFQMSGKRSGFAADAFHQIAVASTSRRR